jgi:hypothetical protein
MHTYICYVCHRLKFALLQQFSLLTAPVDTVHERSLKISGTYKPGNILLIPGRKMS